MSGDASFEYLQKIVAFLAAVWFAGRLCRRLHISPIIGEIAAGILMGPEVLNLVPEVARNKDGEYHSLWQVMGNAGVTLMIAESGTHIHFDKLKKVGKNAFFVAIFGTFVPLFAGMGFAYLFDTNNSKFKSIFAAGCALAPTSVGIALKLLTEAKQLNSFAGQTIVTAAFLDDVFSIVLLVMLESFGTSGGSIDVSNIFLTALYCFIFLGFGMLLSIYVFSDLFPKVLSCIPWKFDLNYQPRDEIHLVLMLTLLVGYALIGNVIGSYLLGAFIAGMSFSQVSRSMYVWRRQMKRISNWLVRFFFACSVAFTIPIKELISVDAAWKGLIFAIIPAIAGKLIAGLAAWKYRYIVGFAMVGRGEFAYLVAQTAKSQKLISDEMYAIIVWALLIAVFVAPISFKWVLNRASQNEQKSGIQYFRILAEGHHHCGIHFEIVDVLHNLKLDIFEAKVETDGDIDASIFVVGVPEGDSLDSDKIEEIRHDLREAISDPECEVQLQPIDRHDVSVLLQGRELSRLHLSRHSQLNQPSNDDYPNYSQTTHTNNNNLAGGANTSSSHPAASQSSSSLDTNTSLNSVQIHVTGPSPSAPSVQTSENTNNPQNNNVIKQAHRSFASLFAKSWQALPSLSLFGGSNNGSNGSKHGSSDNMRDLGTMSAIGANNTDSALFRGGSNGKKWNKIDKRDKSQPLLPCIALDDEHWLEIKLMIKHAPIVFIEIINTFDRLGIMLVKGIITDFLNTDNQVFYAKSKMDRLIFNSKAIKSTLKAVLKKHKIKGDAMVKVVRKREIALPNHPKMSELLLNCTNMACNPLLSSEHSEESHSSDHGSNSVGSHGDKNDGGINSDPNGYEIDIDCDDCDDILWKIINICDTVLKLDIRSADIESNLLFSKNINNNKNNDKNNNVQQRLRWTVCLFACESENGMFSRDVRRKEIETNLVEMLKQQPNMSANIKIKAIEVGCQETISNVINLKPNLPSITEYRNENEIEMQNISNMNDVNSIQLQLESAQPTNEVNNTPERPRCTQKLTTLEQTHRNSLLDAATEITQQQPSTQPNSPATGAAIPSLLMLKHAKITKSVTMLRPESDEEGSNQLNSPDMHATGSPNAVQSGRNTQRQLQTSGEDLNGAESDVGIGSRVRRVPTAVDLITYMKNADAKIHQIHHSSFSPITGPTHANIELGNIGSLGNINSDGSQNMFRFHTRKRSTSSDMTNNEMKQYQGRYNCQTLPSVASNVNRNDSSGSSGESMVSEVISSDDTSVDNDHTNDRLLVRRSSV